MMPNLDNFEVTKGKNTNNPKLDEQVSITHVLSKHPKQEIHIDPQLTKEKVK